MELRIINNGVDAELFKMLYCSASLRDIMCLYFDEHIQGKGVKHPCKIAAMKLLHIFLSNNPKTFVSQLVGLMVNLY